MKEFLALLADIFEVDEDSLSEATIFREEVEDFSSLMGFSILVMMEEDYGKKMSVEQFLECKTIGDLYRFVTA